MTTYMEVVSTERNGTTGVHIISVRMVDEDDQGNMVTGPIQYEHVAPSVIVDHHGNNVEDYLLNVVKPRVEKHWNEIKHQDSHLHQIKGKKL